MQFLPLFSLSLVPQGLALLEVPSGHGGLFWSVLSSSFLMQ